mgnify:FL=1
MSTFFNLPEKIIYCKKCLMSNQRPNMCSEHYNTSEQNKDTTKFHDEICDACKYSEQKKEIDWEERENKFKILLDKYRSRNGSYDVVVPGSGGKDSFYAAHVLKYKYKMNPITCTFAPNIYTKWGYANFTNWIDSGFSNYKFTADGEIHRLITRLAIENILHPFQPWILGQKNYPTKFAIMTKIPLIVYGDNPAEYGNPNADLTDDMNMEWFSCKDQNEIYISGYPIKKLKKDLDLTNAQLEPYVPVTEKEFKNQKLKYVSLSYFTNWHPQHNYYYTIENSNNFQTSGERNCGTYTTNSGLDDKIDDLHYYTTFIKFGLGRVHYDAAQEIRSGDITIEEGKELIKKYNGEFPDRWFDDISKYLTINPNKFPKIQNFFTEYNFNKDYFMSICDKFRSPHLWKKENNIYKKNFNI